MRSIFSFTSKNFSKYIFDTLGKGERHALLLYKEWYREGTALGKDNAFKNSPLLLENILARVDFSLLKVAKQLEEGKTGKFLLQTEEGYLIESVAIPMKDTLTLCISSQVGCKMGCHFCQTGRMGLIRSLSREEIVAQVFSARHILSLDVRNIVFMGMGEPFDNYEEVKGAVDILTDPNGLNFGPSRITISTSGLVEKIYKMAEEFDPAVNLAVSLNGSNDAVRSKLMPINRKHPMSELRVALKNYCSHPRRKILIEYIMIDGKTDGLEMADEMAHFLEGLNVTINLIPYNPQLRPLFAPSSPEVIESFAEKLRSYGYLVFVRTTKGQKIMAACGQLGKRSLVFSEKEI